VYYRDGLGGNVCYENKKKVLRKEGTVPKGIEIKWKLVLNLRGNAARGRRRGGTFKRKCGRKKKGRGVRKTIVVGQGYRTQEPPVTKQKKEDSGEKEELRGRVKSMKAGIGKRIHCAMVK